MIIDLSLGFFPMNNIISPNPTLIVNCGSKKTAASREIFKT